MKLLGIEGEELLGYLTSRLMGEDTNLGACKEKHDFQLNVRKAAKINKF